MDDRCLFVPEPAESGGGSLSNEADKDFLIDLYFLYHPFLLPYIWLPLLWTIGCLLVPEPADSGGGSLSYEADKDSLVDRLDAHPDLPLPVLAQDHLHTQQATGWPVINGRVFLAPCKKIPV